MTREEIQNKVLELSNSHNNLLLTWATGVGKSLASILLQEYLQAKLTYIVVAEVAHIDNWKKEYIKYNKEYLLEKTIIFCYASLKKNIDGNIDLLILDETHHATSDIRIDYLNTINTKNIIALSATMSQEKIDILSNTFGEFHEYNITLKNAIEWGIIPKPKIYLIPLTLDNKTLNQEIIITRGLTKNHKEVHTNYTDRWSYLKDKVNYKDLKLIMKATTLQKSNWFDEQFNYYKRIYFIRKNEALRNKWLLTGSLRKRFLAESKTDVIKKLIKYVSNKRFICFSGSIEQANILGNNVVHSKTKNPLEIIDKFNNKELSNLIVVDMLKEGQNLTDIQVGIISQLDGTSLSFIQKMGRVLRGENPEVYILYYKNTRDEDYLQNIRDIIPKDSIFVLNNLEKFN